MIKFAAGQELGEFTIYPRGAALDEAGRVRRSREQARGVLRADVAEIKPREALRARGMEHPATHRLIARGRAELRPGDVLVRAGESYTVQSVRDPGMLGLYTVALCERRGV